MVLVLALAAIAGPVTAQAPTPDPDLLAYAKPGILADIGGGRRIHLLCMGVGSPTVILGAGLGNWGETWRKVQPAVAAKTRVCTWDRPGFGFSSPSPEPQTVAHTARDLERALKAAKIVGPYVLVGHSLGGLEVLMFADRNRAQVAGMVLEDPSFPGQFEALKKRTALFASNIPDMQRQMAEMDRCAAQARAHTGDPRCPPFPPTYPAELTAALKPSFADPAKWQTRKSLSAQFEADTIVSLKPDRSYGDIPLIVLTATETGDSPPDATPLSADANRDLQAWQRGEWKEAHDRLAALSTRGENRLVAGSSHYIHLIKPDVVIGAIDEVVAAVRKER
jgi:pimeloyl-ACP methyl ester carboxylesterase